MSDYADLVLKLIKNGPKPDWDDAEKMKDAEDSDDDDDDKTDNPKEELEAFDFYFKVALPSVKEGQKQQYQRVNWFAGATPSDHAMALSLTKHYSKEHVEVEEKQEEEDEESKKKGSKNRKYKRSRVLKKKEQKLKMVNYYLSIKDELVLWNRGEDKKDERPGNDSSEQEQKDWEERKATRMARLTRVKNEWQEYIKKNLNTVDTTKQRKRKDVATGEKEIAKKIKKNFSKSACVQDFRAGIERCQNEGSFGPI